MTHELTVATGPPGTGKSQLVANLVATAVANGQRVLVASTNNRAVNEVWQRCVDLVPGSVVRTGSSGGETNYRDVERETLQKLRSAKQPTTNVGTARANLLRARKSLDTVVDGLAEKAEQESQLLRIAERREKAAEKLGCTAGELGTRFQDVDTGRLAHRARKAHAARLFGQLRRTWFLRKIRWQGGLCTDTCSLLSSWADLEQQWRSSRARIVRLADDNVQRQTLDERNEQVRTHSQRLLQSAVLTAARAGGSELHALLERAGQHDWSEVSRALKHVRGWAVTNLSVRRFPTTPALFDLVIVDEASQCSIPQVLPVLFRAKRALVIGDPMQLKPVITLTPAREADIRRGIGVSASWLDEHRITYHRHSAFHAFEQAVGKSLLLDEHFRCHPAIAEVANTEFYGGKLTVLTDTSTQRRLNRAAVLWVHAAGTAQRVNDGSWTNEEEADLVDQSVHHLLKQLPPDGTVGVVTPFKAQAALLNQRWRDEPQVRVGTVHTFQGGERDVIVFSLVAGNGMASRNMSLLSGNLNLWNVAITRARSHLLLVGDRELWRKHGGIGGVLVNTAGDAAEDAKRDPAAELDALDPLMLRLHEKLDHRADADVDLLPTVDGYSADALLRDPVGSTAVLLDRGYGSNDDSIAPARHLRLQYERQRLLSAQDNVRSTLRIPAWHLFDDDRNTLASEPE